MSEEIKLFKVTIDGQTTEVLPGTTIIEAARKILIFLGLMEQGQEFFIRNLILNCLVTSEATDSIPQDLELMQERVLISHFGNM